MSAGILPRISPTDLLPSSPSREGGIFCRDPSPSPPKRCGHRLGADKAAAGVLKSRLQRDSFDDGMGRDHDTDGSGGGRSTSALTGKGLDTLLAAAETLPHAPEDAWRLDLFRVALRIARSTESVADLERANLAFRALPHRLRNPLVDRAAMLARREAERAQVTAEPEDEPKSGGLLGGLFGRGGGRPSRKTAKERLMRELTTRRDPDDDREI